MRAIILYTFVFVAICGSLNAQRIGVDKITQIVNGNFTDISDVPWQVSLELAGRGHRCGGVILNSEWILSAAHCVIDNYGRPFPDSIWMVHVGSTYQLDDNVGQRVSVDRIIMHSGYVGGATYVGNDFALFHLSEPLCFNEDVQPIEVADTSVQLTPGMEATISGWGKTMKNGSTPNALYSVEMTLISDEDANWLIYSEENDECSPLKIEDAVDERMIALLKAGVTVGHGDSGGPAVFFINGEPVLVGICSWWGGCPYEAEYPVVYGDVRAFTDFIMNNIELRYEDSEVELSENYVVLSCESSDDNNLNDYHIGNVPAGASLIWSTDDNSRDGVEPIIDPNVWEGGTFYAYYAYEGNSCFSAPSKIVVEVENCCDNVDNLAIWEDAVWNSPRAYSGNITVGYGATLTLRDSVLFGAGKKLIIEDGGTVEIKGSSAVLSVCEGVSRWGGIEVKSGGNLIVDDGDILSAHNAIHALSGSSVEIRNLVVKGPSNHSSEGIGMFLEEDVDVSITIENVEIENYKVGIEIINSGERLDFDGGKIRRCEVGMKLHHSPARINNYDIEAKIVGIMCSNSPGLLIENNTIDVWMEASIGLGSTLTPFYVRRGIDLTFCDGAEIKNNRIGLGNYNLTYGMPYYIGISIAESVGGRISDGNEIGAHRTGIYGRGTNYDIMDNIIKVMPSLIISGGGLSVIPSYGGIEIVHTSGSQILRNDIEVIYGVYGINSEFSNGIQVESNNIRMYRSGPLFSPGMTMQDAAGIQTQGSNNQRIAYNKIEANGYYNGIIATNSPGNTYDCNDVSVDGSGDALGILYNSQGQFVKGNTLTADNNNDLFITSVIGIQEHYGNEFVGGNALAEDDMIAYNSQFKVNPNNPYHMPTNPIPSEGWFIRQDDVQNYYTCAHDAGTDEVPVWDDPAFLCTYYEEVMSRYGSNSEEYIQLVQTLLRYELQREGYGLPSCIKDAPQLPESWQELLLLEKTVRTFDNDRLRDAALLHGKIEEMSTAYARGSEKEFLERNASTLDDLTSRLLARRAVVRLKLQGVRNQLDQMESSDPIMDEVLPLLQSYVDFQLGERKDVRDLMEYSRLCAERYGSLVHLARGVVHPVADEYFAIGDRCVDEGAILRKSASFKGTTSIYPNPSNGRALIDFGSQRSGRIIVTDISGRALGEWTFEERRHYMLDVSGHPGLQIIHIHYADGRVEQYKHLVIK